MFSWPIFFARLGGMACAVWTALLFLSMSRSILTIASRFLPRRGRSFWLLGGGWIFYMFLSFLVFFLLLFSKGDMIEQDFVSNFLEWLVAHKVHISGLPQGFAH